MLETLRQDWYEQWQTSPLLRLGSWGIGLILLLYGLLWLDDVLSLRQLEWRRQADAIAEMAALRQQEYWPEMVRRLETQREDLLTGAWQASTAGLAKAAVREFLQESAAGSAVGLELRQSEFGEPQPLLDGVHEMRGRISAQAEERTVPWGWIAALESHRPAFLIDSLDIRVGSRSGVAMTMEFRVVVRGLENSP